MATGIQVLHIEKRISIASGLNRHITRQQFVSENGVRTVEVWVPDNADPNRTAGNVELISRERVDSEGRKFELTLQQAVDLRIQEAGVKPRKGQSTCMEIIFSGSRDVMTAMSRRELLRWADDTLAWAQETWGKDNVVSASLHVDEMTPHVHMIVVPIVTGESRRTRLHKQQNKSSKTYNIDHDRLRLCVNEVYTQGKLYEYHDSYAKKVSLNYGLSRGVKAEPGSKKKHTSSIDYNRHLTEEADEKEKLLEELMSDYNVAKSNLSLLNRQITIKEQEYITLHTELDSINETINSKIDDLNSLTSFGLLQFFKKISDKIIEDLNELVKGFWKGTVQSYELARKIIENQEHKVVRLNMLKNNNSNYYIEVRLSDGAVFLNGKNEPYRSKKMDEIVYMKDFAKYFTKLTPAMQKMVIDRVVTVTPKISSKLKI